ncbi:hypothetical protein [Endozoicomonas sp. GU-1]|uniref:hypothetical protein n=1 Tax=Endozoicomonas sp. GU-1 TaxID=3009078 RepID=UPI0022B560CE|nr:hypothetical protein [Endozoicomonas sp. GU-1]WBA79773.1 hypothetical protein O2T12_15535 [Endozoicomonas sp. GU-1]WBA87355.1 hypothetical protein O3276_04800 [Endozoicomonas sp. GU-1]
MLIEQEVSSDIEELTALFKQSPEKAEQAIRELFTTGQRFTPEARNIQFSETQFDIAPSNAHLSFADLQVSIEVVL